MSWEIFKQNILLRANNPGGIPDIDTVAKLYAKEYDAAIKRGFNTLTPPSSVKSGNVELMEQFFKLALQKGLTSTQPYDLVGEMGKGVLAYWGTGILNEFPIPLIPAIGTTANISVTTNIVTNPGVWTPPITLPPEEDIPDEDAPEEDEESAAQDLKDSEANKVFFKSLFDSEEDADNHNKALEDLEAEFQGDAPVYVSIGGKPKETNTMLETIESISPNATLDPETNTINTAKKENKVKGKKQTAGGPNATDNRLFALAGNGYWPATYKESGKVGVWDVDSIGTAAGCPRYMYTVSKDYSLENIVKLDVPLAGGRVSKEYVHKKFAEMLRPLFAKIKAQGLNKHIANCAGAWVVRNVTCGTRLSHHSWALAIDINTTLYEYGDRFTDDGIYRYNKKTKKYDIKKRDLNDKDLGHYEVAKILTAGGITWLSKNDPMHFSIYE